MSSQVVAEILDSRISESYSYTLTIFVSHHPQLHGSSRLEVAKRGVLLCTTAVQCSLISTRCNISKHDRMYDRDESFRIVVPGIAIVRLTIEQAR